MRNIIVILLIWMVIPIQVFSQNQSSVEGDRQALVDLYNATNGSGWSNNSGWLNGNPSNEWYGIEVNGEGRVVRINMLDNGLNGELPASIGNLSKLEYLNLKQNSMVGDIPTSIGNLDSIVYLLLSGVSSDPPDNTGHDIHQGKSDNSGNTFTGSIPSSIGNLQNLEYIEISGSQIEGSIPMEIGNAVNLKFIAFSWNTNLTGSIPSTIGNLRNLIWFYARASSLTGNIPPELNNVSTLRHFHVGNGNSMTGELPDLSNLKNLRNFNLDGNNFYGEWPSYWNDGSFDSFISLRATHNNFSGDLHGFENLRSIISFDLTGNRELKGDVGVIKDLMNAKIIGLGWTSITGDLSEHDWSNFRQLRTLYLNTTDMYGPLTAEFLNAISNPDMKWAHLYSSGFTSTDTESMIELNKESLLFFDISNNYLSFEEHIEPAVSSFTGVDFRYGNQSTPPDDGSGDDEPTTPSIPSLQSPSSGASNVSVNPTFSWSSVSADSYTIRVYTSGGSMVFESTGTGNSYTTPSGRTLDYDTEYSWRVRATRDGLSSDWSSSRSFTTESIEEPAAPSVPSLQSPSNGATNVSVNPDFSWSSVNADSYTLQVYTTGGSQVFEHNGSGNGYTTPSGRTLEHDTEYSWRVRATRDGLSSEWSSSRSFTTESDNDGSGGGPGPSDPDGDVLPAPNVQSPADGAIDVSLTPTLEWTHIEGADSYILHVSATNPSEMVIEETVDGITFTPETPLVEGRTHQWRVRGVKDGVEGEWSVIADFTTQSENDGSGNNGKAPRKATPAKDEKNVKKNTAFTWESVEGAESYTIEIREASTTSLFVGEEVTDTVYVANQPMKGNTEYTWRVRATVEGLPGEWSDEWEFTTEEENEENAFVVELDQNYPNPFNPSTNIRFTLSETQEVSLKVYDMAGRLVASLVDGSTFTAGTHSASFNAQSLASGIYFYRLITPGEIVTRKMTLMK